VSDSAHTTPTAQRNGWRSYLSADSNYDEKCERRVGSRDAAFARIAGNGRNKNGANSEEFAPVVRLLDSHLLQVIYSRRAGLGCAAVGTRRHRDNHILALFVIGFRDAQY